MELINKNSSFVSITTLEIAELCGKEHKNVLRDCDEQLTKIVGAGGMLKFGHTYTHPQNRQTYRTPYGSKVSLKTLVTGKGQIYFTEKLRNRI